MQIKPIGTGEISFDALIEQNCFYVDKTDFIRQWWNEKKPVTLITRPRRFGKTMTLSMVDTFFSPLRQDGGKLFEHLSIHQDSDMMALQGKIPDVFLSQG